jgi:DNA-directed RNA polymerase specialized sigma24 family protein
MVAIAPRHPLSMTDTFEAFFAEAEPRLRRALVARFGVERGREATAEALAWAYEHWSEVQEMDNPIGYLYRVGQSRTRPRRTIAPMRVVSAGQVDAAPIAPVDPELWAAMWSLSAAQRQAVVLVHAYGWTLREVAELTETSVSTVGTHLRRGLVRLRATLERAAPIAGDA